MFIGGFMSIYAACIQLNVNNFYKGNVLRISIGDKGIFKSQESFSAVLCFLIKLNTKPCQQCQVTAAAAATAVVAAVAAIACRL